jgi:hypothetical protein
MQHLVLPDEIPVDFLAQGGREAEEERVSCGRWGLRMGMGGCSGGRGSGAGAGNAAADAVG